MLKLIKKMRQASLLIGCFVYDFRVFLKGYGGLKRVDKEATESWLLQDIHRIEKGFTLRNPRSNYGWAVLRRLDGNIKLAKHNGQLSNGIERYLGSVMSAYRVKNEIPDDCAELALAESQDSYHANLPYRPKDLMGASFDKIIEKRRSVRQFDRETSLQNIERALAAARGTPSVCNRQYIGTSVLTGDEMSKALELQNGNDSFRSEIKQVLVVYARLRYLTSPYERYQGYIDGGMYCMNLINYLAFLGVGSCPLNWSATPRNDQKLKSLGVVPKNSSVVMMIAIGEVDDTISTASSRKI
ncbi:nitroreductase family protein [Limimaricola pyoseonensis]|uniref:Nitroreductase n=1 Tax=Limimaricola pyoseonensis TaxID=521013 RepID=A0A1G7KKM4_9RHOB|nr:nitroreductase family protein [Limimaricola pyoseonensis]SDF37696.1 Nitroreductase [Limimaricola pyoseonensis]